MARKRTDWRLLDQIVEENLASRRGRKSSLNMSEQNYQLVETAARERGISIPAYCSAAAGAFASYDLGVDLVLPKKVQREGRGVWGIQGLGEKHER